MARPLWVLSRIASLFGSPSPSTHSCRFSSRGASGAWMGQSHAHRDRKPNRAARHSDDMSDEELEDVEDKLQAFIDEERKRQRRVKFHILRRQMTPPGAPPRKLTWDAIEQIRYLKQEQPEDWTVERLAQGFSVTPDVILRVLRSQFVPGPDRKVKQDAKVMAKMNQQGLLSGARTGQDRPKLQGNHTSAALSPGSKEEALVPVADKTMMIRGEGSGSLAKSPAPVTVLHTQSKAGVSKDATTLRRAAGEDSTANTYPTLEEEEDEEEENWDGQVLTEELERFMEMERPSLPVQVGNDFFDTEGNFLYRI